MLKYDGPLVRKNRELSEFVHKVLEICELNPTGKGKWTKLTTVLSAALLAQEVPYSHPIYGALGPKGSVANDKKYQR